MNISLLLTLIRLILSPILVPYIYFQATVSPSWGTSFFYALLITSLSLTDFLDGYLARKNGQITALGAALDWLADKVFLISALITLLALQRIAFVWVLILLLREMLVTGVRAIALESKVAIPVSSGGKFKTAVQLIYLICMAGVPMGHQNQWWFMCVQTVLLIICTVLSVISGAQYVWKFIRNTQHMQRTQGVA